MTATKIPTIKHDLSTGVLVAVTHGVTKGGGAAPVAKSTIAGGAHHRVALRHDLKQVQDRWNSTRVSVAFGGLDRSLEPSIELEC